MNSVKFDVCLVVNKEAMGKLSLRMLLFDLCLYQSTNYLYSFFFRLHLRKG